MHISSHFITQWSLILIMGHIQYLASYVFIHINKLFVFHVVSD